MINIIVIIIIPKGRLVISRPKVSNSSSLGTWRLRSWSWDLVAKVLVSRPGGSGLGLETSGKVLISKFKDQDQSFLINIIPP